MDYDVIVLGAGISGLLIASALATEHRVLLLEKTHMLGIKLNTGLLDHKSVQYA